MTNAQIAVRKDIYRRLRRLSDADVAYVSEIIEDLEGHEPNEETIAALRESADMSNLIGPFNNMEDFMASLLSDDDA